MMISRYNLQGEKFSKITVLSFSHTSKRGYYWRCICDCGNICIIQGSLLRSGNTKSCGCLATEARIYNGKNNQSKAAKARILKDSVSGMNVLYSRYRTKANQRKIVFQLTIEQFSELTNKECFYCNIEPKQISKTAHGDRTVYLYNGIDRVDNSKGYMISNCVPCCRTCNQAKSTMSKDEFLTWIHRVYHHSFIGE